MDNITTAGRSCILGFCSSVNILDFGMSTRGTATLAVDVLRRVGYADARHEGRRLGLSKPIISVAADEPGDADEILRVVHRIDPDARPLHHRCRLSSGARLKRTQPHARQMDHDKAGARLDEAVSAADERRAVDEAAGMLIAKCGLTALAAFQTIVVMASENNREVYDVAREIVAAGHTASL